MTISEFAYRIHRERTTVYDIFERKSIDIDLLISISEALDFDFIHEVYIPKNYVEASSKVVISIEFEKNEMGKLVFPYEFVRWIMSLYN